MIIKKLLERNALFIAILFTIIIALVSLVSLKDVHLIKTSNSDKLGHVIAYFFLSLSWLNVSKFLPINKYRIVIIISLVISYGIILEVLQDILTSYRQADLYDTIANSIGVLAALFIFSIVRRKP